MSHWLAASSLGHGHRRLALTVIFFVFQMFWAKGWDRERLSLSDTPAAWVLLEQLGRFILLTLSHLSCCTAPRKTVS